MNPQEYEKLAAVEDRHWYFRSLHAHFERALREALPRGRPVRILDAGCGTGGLMRRLQPRHPDWTWLGVDVSVTACEWARKRASAEIIQAPAEAIPQVSGSCDAIVSADLLCQVDDPARVLAEFGRLLRPGGLLIVNLPASTSLWSYHDEAVGNLRRFDAPEVRALLAKAGFRGLRLTHWNTLLFPLLYVRRRILNPKTPRSDVAPASVPVELLGRAVMGVEHAWLGLGFTWSFGASLFLVARKPLAEDRL